MDTTPLVDAARELRQRLVALLDSLSTIRSLTDLRTERPDDEELLLHALRVLMQHQDFARASVFRLQDGELVCAAARDYGEVVLEAVEGQAPDRSSYRPRTFRIGQGLAGLAVQTRTAQFSPDCANDPRYLPLQAEGDRPTGSLISAPILNGDEVLAVVNVHHPQPGFFRDWHHHVVAVFCSVLGLMMANHRARRHLEGLVTERTRQLQQALAEAEELKRRYEELSTVDDLTGLHNRRFFKAEGEAALARSMRYEHPFCLMLIDLDFFKHVNDTFGHGVGDMVLRDLARVLRRHTREGDILARYGGEEFILALPNTDLDGARATAERIREHVRSLKWESQGRPFRVTLSIGVASFLPQPEQAGTASLQTLIREADEALYYCKGTGRDRVRAHQDLHPQGGASTGP